MDFPALAGERILVAGATGLLGHAVVRALLDATPSLTVVAAARTKGPGLVLDPRVEFRAVDLTRAEDCRRAAKDCSMAVLAAATTGGAAQARTEPWRQVTDNAVLDAVLLDALHSEGVRRAVLIGTASSYQPSNTPLTEADMDWNLDPVQAHFGVGWAKRWSEKLCEFWHQASGIEILIARAANIYGPFAKFNPAASNVVAALVRKAVDRQDPFELWGEPDSTRDLIHAADMAEAVVRMLAARDVAFDVFNIGSGQAVTVRAIMEAACAAAGHRPREIKVMAEAPSTITHRVLECGKAERVLDWRPRIGLMDGIKDTVNWWQHAKEYWSR